VFNPFIFKRRAVSLFEGYKDIGNKNITVEISTVMFVFCIKKENFVKKYDFYSLLALYLHLIRVQELINASATRVIKWKKFRKTV